MVDSRGFRVWDVAQSLTREPRYSTPAREEGDALGMSIPTWPFSLCDALGMTSSRPDRCNGTQAQIIWRFVQPFLL